MRRFPAARTAARRRAFHRAAFGVALAALVAFGLPGCTGSIAQEEAESSKDDTANESTTSEPGRNRLADETSPYLLQHAENPVHWFPWGDEAFERAEAEGKPIFLSIGYSSCYWCHVMERESFENEEIAKQMNEHFICIKVDREERPDVDQIYMTALQAISGGHGGWPMSMFLTPDGRPFYGGTYFPPEPRQGMPSFPQVLEAVANGWEEQREQIEQDAEQLASYVQRAMGSQLALEQVELDRSLSEGGLKALANAFDPEYGGFSYDPARPRLPKFPEPVNLVFLLDQHRRGRGAGLDHAPLAMVEKTLEEMARGGIRDHLAGGYHRYSTDRFWAVPHFEKMLYDQAQLAAVHLLAYEITGDERWRIEAEATLDFVAEVMTDETGGFHSAIDAETDAEEGKYYVWTRDEIQTLLDEDDFQLLAAVYGLDQEPNFEHGRYVLLRPEPIQAQAAAFDLTPEELEERLEPLRQTLLEARREREMPFQDDKVLTAWNGLMIAAYADSARVLGREQDLEMAQRVADFVLETLRNDDGRLLRTYRAGEAKLAGYLEDYAFLIHGLLRLNAATEDPRWLDEAGALADRMIEDFEDDDQGGFFFTADDHESLFARAKDPFDGATPGPNSVAIRSLVALHRLTGEERYLDVAGRALEAFSPVLSNSASGVPLLLVALEEYLDALENQPDAAEAKENAQAKAAPPPSAPGFQPGQLRVPSETNGAAERPSIVTVEGRVADPARSGEPVTVELELTIEAPYHLNANPAGDPSLIPTQVSVADDSDLELIEVNYPEGESKPLAGLDEPIPLYEGTVTITAVVRCPEDATETLEMPFRVRYQACDDRACLAPQTRTVVVKAQVETND